MIDGNQDRQSWWSASGQATMIAGKRRSERLSAVAEAFPAYEALGIYQPEDH